MTDPQAFLQRITQLSPKRLALLALDLQSRVDALEAARTEPVAVVGMGCRFPGGANDPDAYWRLLRDGVDAISDVPASRWDAEALFDPNPDAVGKVTTRWGGFLDGIDSFDPHFFGISPREAASMDPQQRLLLEVGWEALEHAGYAPDSLGETQTGVFVGICNGDYYQMLMDGAATDIDAYAATGSAHSVASGRLSYLLGLRGPSLSVDTACSSSLVAVHLATQSLRNGECRTALAGGVNAVLTPSTTLALSRARMMASDGRCKPFDDAADGFVRSEGAGFVVLKRLSDAISDGDRILALLRGSATNQDGRSNGLTAPNGPSQVAVIQHALRDAGVEPAAIGYVETHGTGTALGDPIEAQALGAALGVGRPADRPLIIGSAKSNLGHLESAAGIAGLIKTVLTLQHGQIPPTLHFRRPSRHIPWARLPLQVPTTLVEFPDTGAPRLASVSSFGFSGTNAHVVLQEAPAIEAAAPAGTRPSRQLLTISAASETSLRTLATRFEDDLAAHPERDLAEVAHTTHVGRAQLPHRLTVVGADVTGVRSALGEWLADGDASGVAQGYVDAASQPRVAFLFPGQGAQYAGMGETLYATQPAFRAALDECAELLQPRLNRPLLAVMWPASHGVPGDEGLLDRTLYTQPATFAIEYALARMWLAWGIQPTAVLGHSAGEYVAACIAGVFSLVDALKLVVTRGRLMEALPSNGAMASVRAGEWQVARAIGAYGHRVSVAALNGPDSLVISGAANDVDRVLQELALDGVETRRLAISIAAHSPLMDPILDAFEQVAAEVACSAPYIDVISSVTGRLAEGDDLTTPGYWRRHVREPVRFADGVRALDELGCAVMLEVGPTPTLLGMAGRCLPSTSLTLLPSLRSDADDWQQVLDSLGRLWVSGVRIDWAAVDTGTNARRIALPTSPFERMRCWAPRRSSRSNAPAQSGSVHSLLGERLLSAGLPEGRVVYETHVHADWPTFIQDHRIHGLLVLPSPVYVEMALAAASERWDSGAHALEDFSVDQALVIPEEGARTVQLVLSATADDAAEFNVYSRALNSPDDPWSLHASGRLRRATSLPDAPRHRELDGVHGRCTDEVDGGEYYASLSSLGLEFGPAFQGVKRIWRRDGEALGRIELPSELHEQSRSLHIHPALLDACFHVLGAPLSNQEPDASYLLVGIDSLRLFTAPTTVLWDHVVLRPATANGARLFSADIELVDPMGRLVAQIGGVHLKRADRAALVRVTQQPDVDWIYNLEWQLAADAPAPMLAPPDALATALEPQLASAAAAQGLSMYTRLLPELEALSGAWVVQAFVELGWQPPANHHTSTAELAQQLRIDTRHGRLFQRLLEILAEEGFLAREGGTWRVTRPIERAGDLVSRAERLIAIYPTGSGEITLAARCGERLADVLRGSVDPLELLFPGGSLALTENVYVHSPFARAYNSLIARAVTDLAKALPERPLRILEIGGGTGATTRAVLQALSEQGRDCDYTFTDVSPLFVARAQERFAQDARVKCLALDIEVDPATQGFTGQAFDLVLAANVMHATADLRRSLANARELIAPGGMLTLLEGTARQRWVDLTFGLTPGWWRYADADLRPTSALLSAAQWTDLLAAQGFEMPRAISVADGANPDVAQQAMVLARVPAGATQDWVILGGASGTGDALNTLLGARGQRSTLISRDVFEQSDGIRELTSDTSKRLNVVFLWPLDLPAYDPHASEAIDNAVADMCLGGLQALRAAVASESPARLYFVTRGAQSVAPDDAAPAVTQAPIWGLGRVVALEHPDLWGGLIDLPAGIADSAAASVLLETIEALSAGDEDQVAVRPSGRFVPRLLREHHVQNQPTPIRSDGTHLITGGLGGLGLKVARWLAERGARHLTLIGRRAASHSEQFDAIREIEALGTEILVVAADVSSMASMADLFARFGRDLPALRGVMHAAASLGDSPLTELSAEQLADVLRPKVRGAAVLDQLSRALELDYFVLFSSTTALWGSARLGHYAAANTFLDALAQQRHALGLPALSVNWGTWDEMRVASAAERQRVAQFGLKPMPSQAALHILGNLMGGGQKSAQLAVAAVDWPILKAAYEARRRRPLLASVHEPRTAAPWAPKTTPAGPELLQKMQSAPPAEHAEIVVGYVRKQVARVLGVDASRPLDPNQGLFALGMDSLMSVELKGRLEAATGTSLPSTLTFNYPSIDSLARYLLEEVLADRVLPVEAAPPTGVSAGDDDSDDLDDLSEDGLAQLLAAKLARLR
jgi:acyl transferase domain-containing protein/acyl carrier protein